VAILDPGQMTQRPDDTDLAILVLRVIFQRLQVLAGFCPQVGANGKADNLIVLSIPLIHPPSRLTLFKAVCLYLPLSACIQDLSCNGHYSSL
jgi:hypothetical protein